MFIIPAIDLKEGKCVRLIQGRFDNATIYYDNPEEAALKWQLEGAKILHVVDLDGALTGKIKNLESIKKIRNVFKYTIEVGGGIRNLEDIELLFDNGINRIILGTIAIQKHEFIKEVSARYPERIIVGIDAKEGYIATKGWTKITRIRAKEFALKIQDYGIWGIIYTDISRDGMMVGPNIKTTSEMVQSLKVPVIASGGVSSLNDIKSLLVIKNLWGIIIGKALYSGKIDLKKAIELVQIS
jgi:phosphoribosylformimino-5-aminoimidazole carboxamide ribotide isomerase